MLNVIDLFAGAGGLSEGFMQTKRYNFLAHVEWEKPMVETLRENLVSRWGYSVGEALKRVIRFDRQKTEELISGNWSNETITEYGKDNSKEIMENGMDGIIASEKVDVIIGGPPCQAYSLAGRAQDAHSMKNDYRNFLFESFVKVVDHYKPEVFVFENVPGILSAKPGDRLVIDRIFQAFDEIGYKIRIPQEMSKSVYSASDYGVPQERKRVIIIGISSSCKISLESFYESLDSLKVDSKKTVRDAIGNMPRYIPLEKPYKKGRRNISHTLIDECNITNHEARYHNSRDIRVFKYWLENNMNYASTSEKLDFYKRVTGKETNHNKYRNLEWDKPSPTIVSHLYKDGLMFIHPDRKQLRSLTAREAALIQTFPEDYIFSGSMAYNYKMIGNAVPVGFAKSIAQAIINKMEK